jgi:hypothetical protein
MAITLVPSDGTTITSSMPTLPAASVTPLPAISARHSSSTLRPKPFSVILQARSPPCRYAPITVEHCGYRVSGVEMIDRHAPRSIRFSITRYQHSLRDVLPYFARHDASDEGLGDAILSGKVYLSNITDCIATTYLPNGIIGQFGVRLSCSGCPTMPPRCRSRGGSGASSSGS